MQIMTPKKKTKKNVMWNKKNISVGCWEKHVDEGWKQIITTQEKQELAWCQNRCRWKYNCDLVMTKENERKTIEDNDKQLQC
jgi:hypothetical protein